MQKHELNEFIINLVGATKGMQIITAVEACSSASNNGKPLVVRSASGCELMKCKYYVDGKCTDPNDWVNENGDAVCGLREDAILVE